MKKLLEKPELFKMLVDKCGTDITAHIVKIIYKKLGNRGVSATFVNTMTANKNTLFLKQAEMLADFLGIGVEEINYCKATRHSPHRGVTWEFSPDARRLIAATKLWSRTYF